MDIDTTCMMDGWMDGRSNGVQRSEALGTSNYFESGQPMVNQRVHLHYGVQVLSYLMGEWSKALLELHWDGRR